ncbi:hypothetical protein [Streptomyces sp. NPDC051098]|uniref:hypothetical protein n=1 Tax=Streptomyces sp. NPDC051098 TaxID=3155411 RepID=UPI00341EBCBC
MESGEAGREEAGQAVAIDRWLQTEVGEVADNPQGIFDYVGGPPAASDQGYVPVLLLAGVAAPRQSLVEERTSVALSATPG